jgi:carboxyl-terminal processing protease
LAVGPPRRLALEPSSAAAEDRSVKPELAWPAAAFLALTLVLVHEGTLVRVRDGFTPEAREVGGMLEVRDIIRERWVETPQDAQLLDGALAGMVATLDPFSDYISAEELAEFEESTTGKFGGLGIYIAVENGLVVVIAPIEDTPAWEAGMLPGDKILAVDGVPCEFTSDGQAVRALKGAPGTTVTLSVLHEGASRPVDITIERAVIQIRSVKGTRLIDPTHRIGYLRMTTFNSGTVDELKAALDGLEEQDMRGLVLDLRDNPGGFLAAATQVADAFLPEGAVLVKTRGRSPDSHRESKAKEAQRVAVPMTVLIDRGSASASEILAGALDDHERATLVGARSYGKGSVQSIISVLAATAELKLTTQYYFTPKDRRIHRGDKTEEDPSWGLIPDIEVAITRERRNELKRWESVRDMEERKSRANGEGPPEIAERLIRDDPQVRAAVRHLLETLGDPVEGDVARVDSSTPSGEPRER